MRAIAIAHQNRNLAEFEKVLRDYKDGQFSPVPHHRKLTVSFRALVGPDNSLSPRRTIRYPATAKPTSYCRTLLYCRS